jgi:hypothetical protein
LRFRRLFYFADTQDQRDLALALEAEFGVHYVLSHKDLDEHSTFAWDSIASIPNFGISGSGEELGDLRLLVMADGEQPAPTYAYTDVSGNRIFHYSLSQNERAIDFTVAGRFRDVAVISSSMDADAELVWAKNYMSAFRAEARQRGWQAVRGVLVSPRAVVLHIQGFRLTQSVRASRTGDLIIK